MIEKKEKLTVVDFWLKLVFFPKEYFRENFEEKEKPYFWFVIIIFGLSNAIDRIDKQFVKHDLAGTFEKIEFLNNWPRYWILASFSALISCYLIYLVGGWFYNLRVEWSKGKANIDSSRFLYLYSSFIPSIVYIISAFCQTIVRDKPYILADSENYGDLFLSFLMILITFYSVYVSYCGVCIVTNPDKWKARFWFLFLPIFVYSLAIFALLALIVSLQ